MAQEPELLAMDTVYNVLKGLEEDAQTRVINWISSKLSIKAPQVTITEESQKKSNILKEEVDICSFSSIPDIFSSANPTSDTDRALLVATFFQEVEEKKEVRGYDVNKELRNLGHGVKNITRTVQQLIDKKPKLMIQTKKSGKSKQAQKKYKVTVEGVNVIKEMLNN